MLQHVYYTAAYRTSDRFTKSRAKYELAFTSDVSRQQSRYTVVASKSVVGSTATKCRSCSLAS